MHSDCTVFIVAEGYSQARFRLDTLTAANVSIRRCEKRQVNNAWDLEIWKMALKNYRAPLLCYFRLFTFVAINSNSSDGPETPTSGQNRRLFSCGTLKFYRWPWKTIGHLFYITASFVLHFIAMCESKLELRSRNAQTGTKFVLASVTLSFDLNLLHGHYLCQW